MRRPNKVLGQSLLVTLAIIVSACGSPASEEPAATTGATSTTAATTTTAAVTSTTVAVTSTTAAEVDDYQQIVDAAMEEGTVSFYAGLGDEASIAQAAAFEAKYPGIQVELLLLGGDALFTRVLQEHEAGLNTADVVAGGNQAHFITYRNMDMLQPYISIEHESIDADARDDEGFVYSTYAARYVPGYNPELIPEAEVPTRWADLGDPKWKGQLVTSDPASSAIAGIAPYVLSTTIYDDDWELMGRIGDNEPLILASTNDVYPAVAAGERPLALVLAYEIIVDRQNQGESIAPIFPEEGIIVVLPGMSIMKEAPHPNAAKLLVDYLLSAEAQQMYTDIAGRSPTRDDVAPVEGTLPVGEEGVPLIYVDFADYEQNLEEVIARFNEAMGR